MRDMTQSEMVREFAEAMGQPLDITWTDFATDVALLRYKLIQEEAKETDEAIEPVEILKELADLIYVANYFAVTYGWDVDTAFNRVHESNMSKLVDGKPLIREDGKVMKGPNYKKPYLRDLI